LQKGCAVAVPWSVDISLDQYERARGLQSSFSPRSDDIVLVGFPLKNEHGALE